MAITVRRMSGSDGGMDEVAPDRLPVFQAAGDDAVGDDAAGGTFFWVDVRAPDEADETILRDRLRLPPLVLEDIRTTQRTVTFRNQGDTAFAVFYEIACGDDGDLTLAQLAIFARPGLLVSVRQGDLPELADLDERWRQDTIDTGEAGPVTLLYSMLDALVDGYLPTLDRIADRVEAIEDRILGGAGHATQRDIVELRRSLLRARRVMASERDALVHLFRKDHPLIAPAFMPFFQDLYDQVNRATETLDTAREMLASTMDAYLSQVNNELNVVVRRLTAWTIILTTLTVVTGVYGMNFDVMPELRWRFGYLYALALMAVLTGGMWLWFRRIRWV